mgnify:CR=1 FL=1
MTIYPAIRVIDHPLQTGMTHPTTSCEMENRMTAHTETTDHSRIETGALLLRLGLGSMFIAHAPAAVTA